MNTVTEGKERELPPDVNGEIVKIATSATLDLSLEVKQAFELKAEGKGAHSRERSSIESRTDLRIAATNEAMRADPTRTESAIKITDEIAKQWVDLDATDFGRIRSETRREFALDAIATHVKTSPEYAKELKDRAPSIAQAADSLNVARTKVEQQLTAEAAAARQQANIDAQAKQRQEAIEAAAVANLAAVRARESIKAAQDLPQPPGKNLSVASNISAEANLEARMRSFDWAYAQSDDAQVFSRGSKEFASMSKELEAFAKAEPAKANALWDEYAEHHKRPDYLSSEQVRPQIPVAQDKPIKRPIDDAEISPELLGRYIVSHEKRSMWDKGTTEFTYRSGEKQGHIAFVDSGKSLTTPGEDRATIRAMLDVAQAKNWKEVTLSGSEEFKRAAWLEANLHGLQARGYEPRQADKQLLQELQQSAKPANSITSIDREPIKTTSVERDTLSKAKQVDGDSLSPAAQTVVANSRQFLLSNDMGEAFTNATINELMGKLRSHEGQVIDHGPAPYKFDQDNESSYFVALNTPAGEQVIWGKGLQEAMLDRKIGEQIILQNFGKKDVVVSEKIRDGNGHVISSQPKNSQLNQWKAELSSRVTTKVQSAQRAEDSRPSFRVFDAAAPRPRAPQRREKEQSPQRTADVKPPARER
jgi:hypothetical protein